MTGLGQDTGTVCFEDRLGKVERDQRQMQAILGEFLEFCEREGARLRSAAEGAPNGGRERHLRLVKGGQR